MTSRCSDIQELVMVAAGRLDELPAEVREHVAGCPSCAVAARGERTLATLLEAAVPAAPHGLEQAVMAALPPRRWRRTVWSLIPVAVSFLIAAAGAVLAGGVPGGSLVTHLPRMAAGGVLAVLGAASDWTATLLALSRTVGATLPPGVTAGASLVALAGLGGLVLAVRRWAPETAWRRGR